MVTETILGFLMSLFSPIVEMMPDIDLSMLSGNSADTFLEWVGLAGYLFPFDTVFDIFKIILGVQVYRIIVSFFKNLWGVLPVA